MKYDDIIELSRPLSKKHVPMSVHDRAAQFAPFAALVGHAGSISETARITERRIELDDSQKEILDRKFANIFNRIKNHPNVEITHFVPDTVKAGGKYVTSKGVVKKFDTVEGTIAFEGGVLIRIEDVIEITEIV